MATIADLQAAVEAQSVAVAAIGAAIADLSAVVTQLRDNGSLNAADQAALDASVAAITSANATLSGEAADAEALAHAGEPPVVP